MKINKKEAGIGPSLKNIVKTFNEGPKTKFI